MVLLVVAVIIGAVAVAVGGVLGGHGDRADGDYCLQSHW